MYTLTSATTTANRIMLGRALPRKLHLHGKYQGLTKKVCKLIACKLRLRQGDPLQD